MNIFYLLYGLLFAAGAGVVFVVSLLCFIMGKWRAGLVVIGVGVATYIGLSIWSSWASPFVHMPVAAKRLAGTYRVPGGAASYLAEMGYQDFSAELILKADGTFTGTRLPACCLHGQDETKEPFTGGYYTVAGRWRVNEPAAGDLRLHFKQATLNEVPETVAKRLVPQRQAPDVMNLSVWKGKPYALAFPLWDGADFNYLTFTPAESGEPAK